MRYEVNGREWSQGNGVHCPVLHLFSVHVAIIIFTQLCFIWLEDKALSARCFLGWMIQHQSWSWFVPESLLYNINHENFRCIEWVVAIDATHPMCHRAILLEIILAFGAHGIPHFSQVQILNGKKYTYKRRQYIAAWRIASVSPYSLNSSFQTVCVYCAVHTHNYDFVTNMSH